MTNRDRLLYGWMTEPSARALHVLGDDGVWHRHTYETLARRARATAAGLVDSGIERNDIVAVVLRPGPDLVAAWYGAAWAGATPMVVAPSRPFRSGAAHDEHLSNVVALTMPSITITDADHFDATGRVDFEARPAADDAVVQLTSGSSGRPRALRISQTALAANVAAIHRWLRWTDADAAAFWVPQYHDMGLVGGFVAPISSRGDLWLMTPEQFVRRPIEYLRCFGARGARLTAIPPFGLDYIVRHVRTAQLDGLDFSRLEGVIVGAELIGTTTLERFAALLEPHGFRRDALLPAYGLAEATLAVTGVPLQRGWRGRSPTDGGRCVVGCGPPLAGVDVRVVDEEDRPVPDGRVGEIVVRGPSVARGYLATRSGAPTTIDAGVVRTGDAAFIKDGELYVLGRFGDSIKIRGRTCFAEALEDALFAMGHPREHNAILLGTEGGVSRAVWVTERLGPRSAEEGLRTLCRLAEVDAQLIEAPPGTIPRTSSGKPRRRALWSAFIEGRIRGKATPRLHCLGTGATDHSDTEHPR